MALFARSRDEGARQTVLHGMRVAGYPQSIGLARSVLDGGASGGLAAAAIASPREALWFKPWFARHPSPR